MEQKIFPSYCIEVGDIVRYGAPTIQQVILHISPLMANIYFHILELYWDNNDKLGRILALVYMWKQKYIKIWKEVV